MKKLLLILGIGLLSLTGCKECNHHWIEPKSKSTCTTQYVMKRDFDTQECEYCGMQRSRWIMSQKKNHK